jgi:hypothetical protein
MVEYDESIYNLIPKEQYVPEKQKRYKSQYPSNLAPTASTFGLKTTSKPTCSNLAGKFNLEGGLHSHLAGGATMGAAKGALKPDTTTFRKKGTGNPTLVDKTEGKILVPFYLLPAIICLIQIREEPFFSPCLTHYSLVISVYSQEDHA